MAPMYTIHLIPSIYFHLDVNSQTNHQNDGPSYSLHGKSPWHPAREPSTDVGHMNILKIPPDDLPKNQRKLRWINSQKPRTECIPWLCLWVTEFQWARGS